MMKIALQHLMHQVIEYIWNIVYFYLRPALKCFLRKTTGLCELQRICYATSPGAERSLGVESSLGHSRSKVLTKISDKLNALAKGDDGGKGFCAQNGREVTSLVEFACEAVCIDKKIKVHLHQDFLSGLRVSLLQIFSYRQIVREVEELRRQTYESTDEGHEKSLVRLWTLLKPGQELVARKSPQWTEIGFQGDDPATDFRGMGILGLEQLVFFAERFPESAQLVLSHSLHPVHGYPFACTGINLTHLSWTLLREGDLKTHFFNARQSTFTLEDFHLVYCHVFCAFDEMWMSKKPAHVMEFSYIREHFTFQLKDRLANELDTVLSVKSKLIEAL